MASLAPTSLDQFPLFTVGHNVHHPELDAAPSRCIPDLSLFKEEEIDVLYERLLTQIDELHAAYNGLLSHLNIVHEVTTETEALFRKCFFLSHNLAGQFDMLGMDRCACHSRVTESKLALFPPIHKQYPLHEISEDAAQQMERLWTSPTLLVQLITTYQLHMTKQNLPLPMASA